MNSIINYCKNEAKPVKDWYLRYLHYDIDFDLAELPPEYLNEEYADKLMIVDACREPGELVDKSYNELFPMLSEKIHNFVANRIKNSIRKELEKIPDPLDNYLKKYPRNTIFVLPELADVVKMPRYVQSIICHEAFHLIQDKLGFIRKYPYSTEGTASFVAGVYRLELLESHNPVDGIEFILSCGDRYVYKVLEGQGNPIDDRKFTSLKITSELAKNHTKDFYLKPLDTIKDFLTDLLDEESYKEIEEKTIRKISENQRRSILKKLLRV